MDTRPEYVVVHSNQVKSATSNNGNFSLTNNDIQAFIGKKARTQFEESLRKARPDMSDAEIEATLDFLHSLEDNKENTAYIKAAIRWVANRSIILPQDNEKARQVFDEARKKNIDIQKYKTLGDLIASPEMKPKEKEKPSFDPDTAKTFSNKQTVTTEGGRVFTVYDVEDTAEGQEEVCKAVAAHYAVSPWCLSTFTSTGKPTQSAINYWLTYNAIPKKIAYENGKPVAFNSEGAGDFVVRTVFRGLPLERGRNGKLSILPEYANNVPQSWIDEGLVRYYDFLNLYIITSKGEKETTSMQFPVKTAESPKYAWWDLENTYPKNSLSDEIVGEYTASERREEAPELEVPQEVVELVELGLNLGNHEGTEEDPALYFKTPQGEIYGFVDKAGNIYLDETVISPEHPIHEYTHLWDRAVQKRNPGLWERGIELMKQLPLWNEILNDENYGKVWQSLGLSQERLDNLVASEVHARLVGQEGVQLLNQISQEQGQSGIVAKLRKWILDFWKALKSTFGNWSQEDLNNLTLEDFNHMTVRDFAGGTVLNQSVAIQPTQVQDINTISNNSASFGVEIDANLKGNWQSWQQSNPNGIVAYRVNYDRYNTPEEAEAGRIGNPFSEDTRGADTVQQFYDWLITGNNYNNPKATEEYRQAIIKKLLSIDKPNILYYKELGRPSHATVLGYLIEHKELLGVNNKQQKQQVESTPTTTSSVAQQKELPTNDKSIGYEELTVKDQQETDLIFDPLTRRNRVRLIARLFSNEIDYAYKEKVDALKRMIEEAPTPEARKDLQSELDNLNRFAIISEITPAGLFERVYEIFKIYTDGTDEERVQAEFNIINSKKAAAKYTEEQKLEAARKKAAYKQQEFSKIVNNRRVFMELAEEASTILRFTERLRISPNYVAPAETNRNIDDPDGNSNMDDSSGVFANEESPKDDWMINFRQISSHDSLSQAVRKYIMSIPRLNARGKYDRDDLGYLQYLDASYVHATLMDKLRFMTTAADMIPLLEDLARSKPWVKQIVTKLQKDETLFSQFYQDFRKDFINYWIQTRILDGGQYKMKTKCLNRPEGTYYLLDAWRDNYEGGIILTEEESESLYDKAGNIIKENAVKALETTRELQSLFDYKQSTEGRLKEFDNEDTWKKIMNLLHMIGIDTDSETLKFALKNVNTDENYIIDEPISVLLEKLNVIFSEIANGRFERAQQAEKDKSEDTENTGGDEIPAKVDLINYFSGAYNAIANLISSVTDDAIESSVRENDKSYYAHCTPSYLGKLLKNLKDVMHNKQRFEEFMQKEFKDYEWFYDKKEGRYLNDWLQQLATSQEAREVLDHKVVLNMDKIDYSDWDSLDYTVVLLTEYWSIPNRGAGKHYTWYHVPILSDTPSAEFIKFRRYMTGDEFDDEGYRRTYKDVILDKLEDLVTQEYNRIALVIERDRLRREGAKGLESIDNYDITWEKNEKGEWVIKSKGGSEFKFLPYLNDLTYGKDAAGNTITFADKISELKNSNSSDELRKFIRGTLEEMMNKQFLETYEHWKNIGLLDRTADDKKYKYLPFEIEESAKEHLEEYFWNSKLATSQIIQLTTTDLAYYKNLEDFQKRYKEVHAPSLRLNTQATYKGERVGKELESTIYLKDSHIVSSISEEIKSVLDDKVKKGELSKVDRDYILTQYNNVNVADAQAYRSLKSYRAIMVMSGQWTDEMEQAYKNLNSKNWTMADFSVIWQTKKPYLYTQVNNPSSVEGHTGIKTPVQHKNSEFLLLAIYGAISQNLASSGRLRAINKFMEDHDIDVVQFESTTKVGGQGKIDLSGAHTEAEVTAVLENATGLTESGTVNTNVVHYVSYEDYGIQTATPEHVIDVEQGVGTQIRKLIMADISEDAVLEVDGKKYTKKELYKLYNAIVTENILQSFARVNKRFSDIKQVEKLLLDEVRGNERYGIDMVRACTLDENGHFTIPLYDEIQSKRIQQLLNSIIKKEVTKQKTKGGALIQVTSYGLTDQLNIVFKDKDGNELSWESWKKKHHNGTREEYDAFVKKAKEEGSLSIAYYECYMPAYSRDFYEALMNDKGVLDASKLNDDLKKVIGYRV